MAHDVFLATEGERLGERYGKRTAESKQHPPGPYGKASWKETLATSSARCSLPVAGVFIYIHDIRRGAVHHMEFTATWITFSSNTIVRPILKSTASCLSVFLSGGKKDETLPLIAIFLLSLVYRQDRDR